MKIVVFLCFLVAVSCHRPEEFQEYFKAIDQNHDGKITLPKWVIHAKKYDTDADQIMSLQEYTAALLPETPPALVRGSYNFYDKMDGASDGVIRYSVLGTSFRYFDRNNDWKISFMEYKETCLKIIGIIQKS